MRTNGSRKRSSQGAIIADPEECKLFCDFLLSPRKQFFRDITRLMLTGSIAAGGNGPPTRVMMVCVVDLEKAECTRSHCARHEVTTSSKSRINTNSIDVKFLTHFRFCDHFCSSFTSKSERIVPLFALFNMYASLFNICESASLFH